MKKLVFIICCLLISEPFLRAQNCTQPSITATSGAGVYCPGEEVTLTITGSLNNATEWQWSTGSCGGTIIPNAKTTSLKIKVEKTISYFVRGIGGCVGSTATCSEIKVYLDTTPPVATCEENMTVNNDAGKCSAVVTYDSPTATDNCVGDITIVKTKGLGSGATFPVGVTTETYSFTDILGNVTECSFTVTVNDNETPVITCPPAIEVENDPGQCGAVVNYSLPTATDNCGVTELIMTAGLGSGSFFPVGTTIETFVAKDAAGNSSTCSLSITVLDTEPPVITLAKDKTSKWPPNHKHFQLMIDDFIASVTDNCPGVSIEDVIVDEISSDEPQNSTGDGNTAQDILMENDCKTVKLLAERQGSGNGRVYSVHIAVVDAHGNIGVAVITAEIPKSNGKKEVTINDGPMYTVNGCDIVIEEDPEVNPLNNEINSQVIISSTELNEGSIETYPNPYENIITIDFKPKADDVVAVELYNTNGLMVKRLYNGQVEKAKKYSWSFELGDIKDHMLILVVNGKNNYVLRKVIKR